MCLCVNTILYVQVSVCVCVPVVQKFLLPPTCVCKGAVLGVEVTLVLGCQVFLGGDEAVQLYETSAYVAYIETYTTNAHAYSVQ